jgi:DNA topoisomerase-1
MLPLEAARIKAPSRFQQRCLLVQRILVNSRKGVQPLKLVVTEKNIAAQKLAQFLGTGKPKSDKVYSTPVYRFTHEGEEWVAIGLKGHILKVDFPERLAYSKRKGWYGVTDDGRELPASVPDSLKKPPFESKRKPFSSDGVDLSKWRIEALPYLVYSPVVKVPSEKDIIRSLKNLAKKADEIIIATDFDREGELIGFDAMHLVREVNADATISRARYSAITKPEIVRAFDNLTTVDEALAHAGESRQYIDLIWGAVLTRYLSVVKRSGISSVRSAGRVQTPTLALVADRERKRLAFKPEDYWVIKARFRKGDEEFVATHDIARFKKEEEAREVMEAVKDSSSGTVTEVAKRTRKVPAPAPFNTTSLMAAAAAEGLSPARSMRLAETLYMNGLTSYPRVDNTVYPASLDLAGTVRMLAGNPVYAPYAGKLLAGGRLTPTRGKTETTDHPPIHPTGLGDPDKLKAPEWKLYNLIARRFLATLSGPATIENTKVTIDVAGEPFVVRGDVLVSPGFRAIYPYGQKKDEQLPAVEKGEELEFLGATLEKKQTEPPARYSQGKLVQEMEKNGLGTKSTRHSIIERLYEVNYLQNNPIEPTQLGMAIIEALEKFAPHITTPDMTAELEQGMTDIAEGKRTQDAVVDHSRDLLSEIMDDLVPRKEEMGEAIADAVAADARVGACPKCGKDLLVRYSSKTRQKFAGCSGWPDCDVTYPLPSSGRLEATDEVCPECGTPQVKVHPFRAKAYLHCLNPDCKTNYEPDLDVGPCPACAKEGREGRLIAQKSPRTLKRFIRCTNYDQCKTSYPLPQRGKLSYEGEVCEHCGAPVVVVSTRRGPWHLCVNMDCPSKAEDSKKKGSGKGGGKSKTSARSGSKSKRSSGSSSKASEKPAPSAEKTSS